MPPLWVWFVLWVLNRRQERATQTVIDYDAKLKELDGLYYALPVVTAKFDTWLVKQVIMWIDAERARLYLLRSAGISEIGTIKS